MADGKFNRYKRDDSERWAIFDYANANGNRAASEKFGLSLTAIKEIRRRIRVRSLRDRERKGIASTGYRMRCLKYGHNKGLYGDYLNDFVSFAMLQFSERGLTNAEWAFTEYARATLGRHGHKKELESAVNADFVSSNQALTTDEIDEPDVLIEFPKSLDGMFACLVFKWGFTLKEIGDMVGKSEAYLSLKIKPVIEQMRSKYGSEKDT